MSKINSRAKGARAEREVAKILREYGYDARRGQQFCGANGDADVVGLPGFHLEVKHVNKLNLNKAIEQSKRDAKENEMPIVVHRKDYQEWKVTLPFEEFLKLLKEAEK